MPSSLLETARDLMRITAIKRLFALVDIRRTEVAGLVVLAIFYAALEGLGLSLLFPVLQYAQNGPSALGQPDLIWRILRAIADSFSLPLNLVTLLMLAFLPILARQGIFYGNTWYGAIVANRIATRMRVGSFSQMMEADPDFFLQRSTGELTGVVLGQTVTAGNTVLQAIKALTTVLLVVIYLAILLALSAPLTLVTMAFAGLVSLIVRAAMVRTREYSEKVATLTQGSYRAVIERIALVRLVKMRAQEEVEVAHVKAYSRQLEDVNVRISLLAANVEVTADPLLMLSAFIVLYTGISVLGLRLAELGMLLFVLTRLTAKVKEFNTVRQTISAGVGSISVVETITREAREANTILSGRRQFPRLRSELTLEDVSFAYSHAELPALRDVSVKIPAGSFTALVGRSGAGKSTLAELLPRLRDVSGGRVCYDGIDVREFELGGLRRGIGYLAQESMLFNDTVRANLTYGLERDASDDEIRTALERSYATFVFALPGGLETEVGDRGVRFSGGERQRLALARVLLDDPSILILDEPTSALDSESETCIRDALSALHGRTTIIVIAHRLATVIAADQLLVLADGQLVEQGTHGQLVAAGGAYQRLFESQLQS
jgi:subfamily B ATP-binding cassette protein MsbA